MRGISYWTVTLLWLVIVLQAQKVAQANIEVLYAPNDVPWNRIVTLCQVSRRVGRPRPLCGLEMILRPLAAAPAAGDD
jgi:hypothetical protein